jgi:zeaxanthin glucosyltransferase
MTVVFLTFHGIGHFHACFRMARLLSSSCAVVFAGYKGFQSLVESQGFGYYPLASLPFGLGFEEWVNAQDKKSNVWISSLWDRWNDRLFKERERELTGLLDRLHPQSILIDAQQATDFVVLYPQAKSRGIKLAIVHTALPLVLRAGYPPLSSLADPASRVQVAIANGKFRFKRFFKKGWSYFKYIGKTNRSIVKKTMKDNGTPRTYLSGASSHLSVHVNAPDEFILSPKEFDFSSPAKSAREHYVGFMPDSGRIERGGTVLAGLLSYLETRRHPLIYLSFGTVSGTDGQLIAGFVKRFIDALADQPLVAAISTMATGKHLPSATLPPNVFLFTSAPQRTVLRRASVFVTHGGINSIKESIYAGVPMIVYPRDPRLDHNGNAARVTFHELGLRGNIRKDSSAEILKKIDILLREKKYRARVEAFRALDQGYTDEHFLELFAGMKPL